MNWLKRNKDKINISLKDLKKCSVNLGKEDILYRDESSEIDSSKSISKIKAEISNTVSLDFSKKFKGVVIINNSKHNFSFDLDKNRKDLIITIFEW